MQSEGETAAEEDTYPGWPMGLQPHSQTDRQQQQWGKKMDKNKKWQKRKRKIVEEVKGVGGAQWRAGELSGREQPVVAMETVSYQLTSCFPFSTT